MTDVTVAPTRLSDYEAVVGAMQSYIDGVVAGRSEIMRANFHPAASFFQIVASMIPTVGL